MYNLQLWPDVEYEELKNHERNIRHNCLSCDTGPLPNPHFKENYNLHRYHILNIKSYTLDLKPFIF